MMKALSIASIFAIGLAGTACSQASEAPAETEKVDVETAETVEASADMGSFNLGLPTDVNAPAPANDGFNLDLPTESATESDGFNLGTDIAASNGLSDLPEISAPLADDVVETAPETTTDDEPVIRLD